MRSHESPPDHRLLRGLNPEQQRAVLSFGRPLLILAGAGSGKTRTITHKIAWLVEREGVPPWRILAMTFTNKAAREMRDRIEHLLGGAALREAWIGTFHSTCLRILRAEATAIGYQPGFVVYDDGDQRTLIGRVMKDLGIGERIQPRAIQGYIDRAKNDGLGPDHRRLPQHDMLSQQCARVYAAYQRRLVEANAMDFGDLIRLTVQLFDRDADAARRYRDRWHYLVVDEFQDTNGVQSSLLALLADGRGNLCVVGDDDQSIYSWRGAVVENILRFPERYPDTDVVRLEQNYRSTATILEAAGAVIAANHGRHAKTLWTEQGQGAPVELYVASNDRDEADRICLQIKRLRGDYDLNEMAVIYRTNAMSRVLEETLRGYGLPYRIYGGLRFFDRAEIKDLLSYLKLLVNPADEVSLSRIINVPARQIGAVSVEKVLSHARERGLTPLGAVHALAQADNALGRKLAPFSKLYRDLEALRASGASAATVALRAQEWSGYGEMLLADRSVEAERRRENLSELLSSIEEFVDERGEEATVASFLDHVTLASPADAADADASAAVSLMTAHSAKGLEFDVVFIAGLEEGLMPHFNSMQDPAALEEERRLCYVAMTRARSLLHLSWARQRRKFGGVTESDRSRFLRSVPRELLRVTDPTASRQQRWREEGATGVPGAAFAQPSWGRRIPKPAAPPPPPPSGGVVIDRTYDQSDDAPGPGTRVRHPSFGDGVIEELRGDGPDAKVRVRFGHGDVRTLIARFLSRIG